MSSSTENAISVPGMLKNMMREGFSTVHCLSELIDDSQGAGARIIKISIEDMNLIVSDNGSGMTRDKLRSSHHFHSRSTASAKHGRFGIGRKHALVHFTALKGVAQTVTKSIEDNSLSQLNIDFPDVIKTGNLHLSAHGIEENVRPIWDKHAVDRNSNGTMTYMECVPSIIQELTNRVNSDNINSSLHYFLGSTYKNYINNGGQIIISVNGESFNVLPIDRLCWDSVSEKDDHTIKIYLNPETKEVRAYFKEKYLKTKKGRSGYLKLEAGKKKHSFTEDSPMKPFVQLGTVVIQCAYSDKWVDLQNDLLTQMGIDVPEVKGDGRPELERILGGTDIERNGKLIAMFEAEKAKSGDKAAYTYTENSRYSIKFTAVSEDSLPEDDDAFTLDDVFCVQVNKSKIDTSLIHENTWKTVEKIRSSFAKNCYDRLYTPPTPEPEITPVTPTGGLSAFIVTNQVQTDVDAEISDTSESSGSSESAESALVEATVEATVEAAVEAAVEADVAVSVVEAETTVEAYAVEAEVVEAQVEPETAVAVVQVEAQVETEVVQEAQEALEEILESTVQVPQVHLREEIPVVEVAPHIREISKTPKELLIQFNRLRVLYTEEQVESAIAKASNVVESGITAKFRILNEIQDLINKLIA